MPTLPFTFLGEDDFLPAMEGPCKAWREANVEHGFFGSFDGARIHYYHAAPPEPKACITIIPGFCEFYGKYHELTWYFYQAGYAFYFIENRGHGYSARETEELDVVHIDSVMTYAKDLKEFLDKVVTPGSKDLKKILWAHSMGGGLSTLFLETYPDYFDAAILNSPMLKIKGIKSPEQIKELRREMEEDHSEKALAAGQKHFSTEPDFEGSSAQSKPRFDYVFAQRLADPHYQTKGGSNNWCVACGEVHETIMENAAKIQIPLVINTAGLDHLIDPEGYREFRERATCNPQITNYEASKHELISAEEETRKAYLTKLFETLEQFTS